MDNPKIVVTRQINKEAIKLLRKHGDVKVWPEATPPSHHQLMVFAKDSEGMLCLLTDQVDEALLEATPHLKSLSTMSVGYEHIDLEACRKRGIQVGHTPGVLTDATADFTLALILSLARRVAEASEYAQRGQWKTWEPELLLGIDLMDATVGIIGMGRIGKAVAKRLHAFGANLIYVDISGHKEPEDRYGAIRTTLEVLLRKSDIVTLHCPLTEDTFHLISQDQFQIMKPSAILINTARGPVVDTEALVQALRMDRIAAVGLDVTDPEPLPPSHPLYDLPNCLITPHIASAGASTREKMAKMAAKNLLAGLRGIEGA